MVFLLNWDLANRPGNTLGATTDFKIMSSFQENYPAKGLVPANEFTAASFPHFYVVDTQDHYQIEAYIESGQVRVIRQLPMDMPGHRLLECVFKTSKIMSPRNR